MLQWLAMITMLIDHIGVVFFPDQLSFRIIGRLAFPIYVYCMVLGYHRTRNFNRYLFRVGLLAIISQPMYMFAFDTTELNVIVTLFLGLLLLKITDYVRHLPILQVLIVITTLVVLSFLPLDYGIYGILLMLLYRYVTSTYTVIAHIALEICFMFVWAYQYVSLLATLLFSSAKRVNVNLERHSAPRWLWRLFYPLHLAILGSIAYFV